MLEVKQASLQREAGAGRIFVILLQLIYVVFPSLFDPVKRVMVKGEDGVGRVRSKG